MSVWQWLTEEQTRSESSPSSEVFSLRFFKGVIRFSGIFTRLLETLLQSSEFVKAKVQKLTKKNGDLKKGAGSLAKKLKSEADSLCAALAAGFAEITSKIQTKNAAAKEIIANKVRDAIGDHKVGGEAEGEFTTMLDIAAHFPSLKKDEIANKLAEEISMNFKYLNILIIDTLKDLNKSLKVAMTAVSH